MAIQFKGLLGAFGHGASVSSYDYTTTLTTIETDEVGILVSVSDNTSVIDDFSNNEQASVTDSAGNTWTKQKEWTHTPTGVAGDGVTVGVWTTQATSQLLVGSTITLTFNSARTDKCCVGAVFTLSAGGVFGVSASPIATTTTGTTGYGTATHSGLANLERIWFRALAKEANATTALTPTAGYTSIGGGRSQNYAQAVMARGEFLISTDTGESSNPTLAVTGDTVGLFFPFKETVINPVRDVPKASLAVTRYAPTLALRINLPGEA